MSLLETMAEAEACGIRMEPWRMDAVMRVLNMQASVERVTAAFRQCMQNPTPEAQQSFRILLVAERAVMDAQRNGSTV